MRNFLVVQLVYRSGEHYKEAAPNHGDCVFGYLGALCSLDRLGSRDGLQHDLRGGPVGHLRC
jgi:hypothetical protein